MRFLFFVFCFFLLYSQEDSIGSFVYNNIEEFEIILNGKNWVFIGEKNKSKNIEFINIETERNNKIFSFKALKEGDYILNFVYQDIALKKVLKRYANIKIIDNNKENNFDEENTKVNELIDTVKIDNKDIEKIKKNEEDIKKAVIKAESKIKLVIPPTEILKPDELNPRLFDYSNIKKEKSDNTSKEITKKIPIKSNNVKYKKEEKEDKKEKIYLEIKEEDKKEEENNKEIKKEEITIKNMKDQLNETYKEKIQELLKQIKENEILNIKKAVEMYEDFLNNFSFYFDINEVYYNFARLLEQKSDSQDLIKAYNYYRKIVNEYPFSKYIEDSKKRSSLLKELYFIS